MNPALECHGGMALEEIKNYIKMCNLPCLAVNKEFKMLAKNRALTASIVAFRKGAGISRLITDSQREEIRFMETGQVAHMEVMVPGVKGVIVACFEFGFLFCFKLHQDGFINQAVKVLGSVSACTPEVLEFCSRMDVAPAAELKSFKAFTSSHMLRQANAGYMMELASEAELRFREYFEPSNAVNSVCRLATQKLKSSGVELNKEVTAFSRYCYGVHSELYTLLAALLAFGGEYTEDKSLHFSAQPWDNKYLIRLEFRSKTDKKTMARFCHGESPFEYDRRLGSLSEQMLFMQCLAYSNGWHFYTRYENNNLVLVLVMPGTMEVNKTVIKRPVSDGMFASLVLMQLAGLEQREE